MRRILTLSLLLLSAAVQLSAENKLTDEEQARPKVGVVLSGGGAKGAAHIGILKYLEEQGIPIDCIVGTSMGSIIGGLYAMGYSPDEMADIIKNVDWSLYMSNDVARRQLSYLSKKKHQGYSINIPFSFGEKESRENIKTRNKTALMNSLPSGVISGNNLVNLFNSLSIGYTDSLDFDKLPVQYACVATELVSGGEKIHRKGIVPMAIRSSMAIPGVFSPVYSEDEVLVDGGMLNNFPVDVCRGLGADIIIGVSLAEDLEKDPEMLRSLPSQIKQLKGIITGKGLEEHKQMCDLFIAPDIKGYGMMSFNAKSIETLVQRGYEAAADSSAALEHIKEMIGDRVGEARRFNAPKARRISDREFTISEIRLHGVSGDESRWLLRKCGLRTGVPVHSEDVNKAISMFYGTNAFSDITYTYTEDGVGDSYILDIRFRDAKPHVISMGMNTNSHDAVTTGIRIGFNDQKLTGFRAVVNLKMGYNPSAAVTFSAVPAVWPRVNLSYEFNKRDVDTYTHGILDSDFRYKRQNLSLYLSEYHLKFFNLKGGVFAERVAIPRMFLTGATTEYGSRIAPLKQFGAFAEINFDNLDQDYFASRGVHAYLHARSYLLQHRAGAFEKRPVHRISGGVQGYIPLVSGRLELIPNASFSLNFTEDAIFDTDINKGFGNDMPNYLYPTMGNYIGGPQAGMDLPQQVPFAGLYETVSVENAICAGADLRLRIFGRHYISARVSAARTAPLELLFSDELSLSDGSTLHIDNLSHIGAALRYSIDTMIGPVCLEAGWSTLSRKMGLFFSMGRYF